MQQSARQTRYLVSGLLLALAVVPGVQAQQSDAYGDGYVVGDFGRVTYYEAGVTIRRAHAEQGAPLVEEAVINSPIFPGDSLSCDWGERAEIQLADGTLIWIDQATEVTFLDLPTPGIARADQTLLQLARGAIRVQLLLDEGAEFRIDSPATSVYPLGDGEYRVEVEPSGLTEVSARRGVTEVVGNDGSVLVRAGMRTEVYPGDLPEQPQPYNTFAADSFDQFAEERAAAYLARERHPGSTVPSNEVYSELPEEVQPYYDELSAHGTWAYDETYGNVWYPGEVSTGWRPYSSGYWAYGPSGYFWVSNEPWGWAPYHYGRWNWVGGRGWCWAPGRIFAGAWVGWSWGSIYIGWSPLNYWNYPCWVGTPYYGYYDHNSWTIVHHKNFHHGNYAHHRVNPHEVGDHLNDNIAVTRPPAVAPRDVADSRTARQRAVGQARADSAARLRPVDGTRPSRNMTQLEERMRARDTGRLPTTGARTPARALTDARGAGSGRSSANRRPMRVTADMPDSGSASMRSVGARSSMPGYERRLTSIGGAGSNPAASSSRGRPSARTLPRTESESRSAPRGAPYRGTNDRMRDLYDRMSTPRATRDRPSTARAPSASRRPTSISTPTAPSARRTVRPQSGRTASPPSTRRTPAGGKRVIRPSTSSGGATRARPGSSSGRSSGGSSRARPGGSSGRSSGGSSRARPGGSSGRSSGGSSGARSGGSSGRSSGGSSGARSGGSSGRSGGGGARSGGSSRGGSSGRDRSGGGSGRGQDDD